MSNDDGAPPIPPPPPGAPRPNPYASVEGTTPPGSPYAAAPPAGTPGAPPPYGAPGAAAPATPGKGMAVTALILGILALLGVAIPIINVVSLIMAIVGLILGVIALRKYLTSKGLPIAAIIVSAIAALLALVFVVLYTIGFVIFVREGEQDGIFDPVPSASPVPESTEDPEAGAPEEPGGGDSGSGGASIDLGFAQVQTPDSGPGSAEEPLAIGETVVIEVNGAPTWELAIESVELNGTERVLASNDLNEPLIEGLEYAVVTLTATNIGETFGDPWFDIEVAYLDAEGGVARAFDNQATAPEPTWIAVGAVDVGETPTGNTVIVVPSEGADEGVWLVYSYFDETGYFFQAD